MENKYIILVVQTRYDGGTAALDYYGVEAAYDAYNHMVKLFIDTLERDDIAISIVSAETGEVLERTDK